MRILFYKSWANNGIKKEWNIVHYENNLKEKIDINFNSSNRFFFFKI